MAELKDYSTTAANNNGAGDAGMAENMAPSFVNNAWREGQARLLRYYEDVNAVNSLAGGTTAYTLAASRTISAYAAGDTFLAVCNATCVASPTLNIDTLGAKNIVDCGQNALKAAQLVDDGIYLFSYDATNDTFICLNPSIQTTAAHHRFHVTRGGTDSVAISDGTTTFLPWTTEVVDVGGCFTVAAQTSAQNRFVVPAGAGGTWLFTAMIESAANMTDGTGVVVRLYKNGVGAYAGGSIWQGGISAPSSQVTVIVDTVATDYWQVYWDHTDSASTRAVDGSALLTYWMGARIA